MNVLIALTCNLQVGANLALLPFFWMLVSGGLLPQRGAIFPLPQATGLTAAATGEPGPLSVKVCGKRPSSCGYGKRSLTNFPTKISLDCCISSSENL